MKRQGHKAGGSGALSDRISPSLATFGRKRRIGTESTPIQRYNVESTLLHCKKKKKKKKHMPAETNFRANALNMCLLFCEKKNTF